MTYIYIYLLLSLVLIAEGSLTLLKAARSPIVLNLKPMQPSNATTATRKIMAKSIRTQPQLFQDSLGIRPGQNFSLDFDAWRDLQTCGLYANLTAKTFIKNNEVYLEVSGIEIPSHEFAPEVSVKDISNRPDFSGGVSHFVDLRTILSIC